MSRETFAAAMKAELDAVVARYEALVRAHSEALAAAQGAARDREMSAKSAEAAAFQSEAASLKAEVASLRAENLALSTEVASLKAENERLRAETERLGAVAAAAQAIEETFSSERKFVEACAGMEGSLLMESIRGAFGRDLGASPSIYAALKGRGLDGLLTQAIKDRGRSAVHAPLLERERAALAALAAAAGCDLIVPKAGARFSSSSMDKASTASEPAEEGNVLECLIPGLRLTGTEGALVFPRVVVASG